MKKIGLNTQERNREVKVKAIILFFQIFLIPASAIWTIVEFLIYLFKDIPFNWLSFTMLVTNVTIFSLIILSEIFRSINEEKKRLQAKLYEDHTKPKKSRFQQRLEDAIKAEEAKK